MYPRAMAADPANEQLWVVDKAGRIQRLDPRTGRASILFRTPEIALGRPCGVTLGPSWQVREPGERNPERLLYVADTHYHRVLIYAQRDTADGSGTVPAPELIHEFGSYGHGPGQFIYLTDVAVLADAQGYAKRLYVGEYGGNDRISIWERDAGQGCWVFRSAFGSLGQSDSPDDIQFDRPQSLALDPHRNRLVVTDSCNHRIGVFTLDGVLVRWIGSPRPGKGGAGSGVDQMAYPFGLQLLEDGTALVTEYGNHRVRHLDLEDGEVLGLYGAGGRDPGHLLNPWAVAMLGRTVYVLDSGNERIQAFELAGRGAGRRPLMAGGPP